MVPKAKPRKSKLTDQQRAAIHYYFTDANFNKSAALRMAGYSTEGNKGVVHRFFNTPVVKAELARRRVVWKEKLELKEELVIERIMIKATANIGEIMLKLQHSGNDLDALTQDELYAIAELTLDTRMEGRGKDKQPVTRLRIKGEPNLKALDMLMRKLGLYQDKVEVNGEMALIEALRAGRDRMHKR